MNIETFKELKDLISWKKYAKVIFTWKDNWVYWEKFLLELMKSEKWDPWKEGYWNYFFSFMSKSKNWWYEKAWGIARASFKTKKELLEKVFEKMKKYGFKEKKVNQVNDILIQNSDIFEEWNDILIEDLKKELNLFVDFLSTKKDFWLLSLENKDINQEKKEFIDKLKLVLEWKQYWTSITFAKWFKESLRNVVSIQYAKEDWPMIKWLSYKIETLFISRQDEILTFSIFRDFKNSFENKFNN